MCIHMLRKIYYGRYVTAYILRQVYYGRYIMADILRPTKTPISRQTYSARRSRLLHPNLLVATHHPKDSSGPGRPGLLWALGPLWAGPFWAGPLWAGPLWAPLGLRGPGPCWLSWALVGAPGRLWAGPLWAGPLWAPLGPCGPPGPLWVRLLWPPPWALWAKPSQAAPLGMTDWPHLHPRSDTAHGTTDDGIVTGSGSGSASCTTTPDL